MTSLGYAFITLQKLFYLRDLFEIYLRDTSRNHAGVVCVLDKCMQVIIYYIVTFQVFAITLIFFSVLRSEVSLSLLYLLFKALHCRKLHEASLDQSKIETGLSLETYSCLIMKTYADQQ